MSTLYTFPGQGAQGPGMLRSLPDSAAVRETLEEAGAVLGQDARLLDTPESLSRTRGIQLALLVCGVAMARHLEASMPPPAGVAGFSAGAFAAAVVARALAFDDAVRLVAKRGELMQAAYPGGYGMLAVLGLEQARLEAVLQAVRDTGVPVYLANLNAPTQFAVSGRADGLARVAEQALAAGAAGVRAIAIPVPSHCPLLDRAADALAACAATVAVAAPRLRYFSAAACRQIRDPQRLRDDLVRNMALPVAWYDTLRLAGEHGMRLVVEMPPGTVLTRLAAVALPQAVCVAAGATRGEDIALLRARVADG